MATDEIIIVMSNDPIVSHTLTLVAYARRSLKVFGE